MEAHDVILIIILGIVLVSVIGNNADEINQVADNTGEVIEEVVDDVATLPDGFNKENVCLVQLTLGNPHVLSAAPANNNGPTGVPQQFAMNTNVYIDDMRSGNGSVVDIPTLGNAIATEPTSCLKAEAIGSNQITEIILVDLF